MNVGHHCYLKRGPAISHAPQTSFLRATRPVLSAHHCDLTWHLRSQLCGHSPNLSAYCPGCSSASVTIPQLSEEYQHPPPCSCHSPGSRPDTCPVLAPAGPFDSQTKLRSPTQPLSELKVLSPCSIYPTQCGVRRHTHSGLKGALGGLGRGVGFSAGPL